MNVNGFYQILQILQLFLQVCSIPFMVQRIQFVEGIVELAAMVEMNQMAQFVENHMTDAISGHFAQHYIECDFSVGRGLSANVWQQ